MICPNCQTSLPDEARFCRKCGGTVTNFAPPEGFEIDPQSLMYCRYDGSDASGAVQYLTWFDPDSGEYRQESRPVHVQPLMHKPPPEPPRPPIADPRLSAPTGFTYDPESKMYYIITPGTDPKTGAVGDWYTWYDPVSGKYQQEFHVSARTR